MTRLERLDAVIKLLSDERRWTKGTAAKFRNGRPAKATDSRAVKWCLGGAFTKIEGLNNVYLLEHTYPEAIPMLRKRWRKYFVTLNDHSTHPEVMAFLGELRAAVAARDGGDS